MKKIIALLLSTLMLSSGLPVYAAQASGKNPVAELYRYFDNNLTVEDKAAIAQEAQEPELDVVNSQEEEPKVPKKKVDPQQNLEAYFDNNEAVSASGVLPDFNRRQQELAAYIKNSDWRTWKKLSKRDNAFVTSLVNMAKFVLAWTELAGFDGLLDAIESAANDRQDGQYESVKAAFDVTYDIFESLNGERHLVDELYTEVQHNAFYLVLMEQEDFNRLSAKYPEVAFLFGDMYTYFRWRYEMRVRDPDYAMNEDNINTVFRTATYINSFLGWWELSNVVKSEMALAVSNPDDSTSLIPFTSRSREEERNNIKGIFGARARSARYFGRVWNNMQDYAAKERNMRDLSPEEQEARGVVSVPRPVRGRNPTVRRTVYKALEPLSDQEINQALAEVRSHYIAVRTRSEQQWQNFVKEQVDPLIKQPAPPAWKEAQQDAKPKFSVEDLLPLLNIQTSANTSQTQEAEVAQEDPAPDPVVEEEESAQLAQEVKDALLQKLN